VNVQNLLGRVSSVAYQTGGGPMTEYYSYNQGGAKLTKLLGDAPPADPTRDGTPGGASAADRGIGLRDPGQTVTGRFEKAAAGGRNIGESQHDGRGAVKFHVTSIMSKLTAASRTKAVMLGLRKGLIML
jgi:hypothetical protein